MINEKDKIIKAREILQKIASGIDPVNGKPINNESFLNDPRIIRCFFFVADILNRVIDGQINRNVPRPKVFSITDEEKSLVTFPDHKIGVNEFSRCINSVIDLNKSKKLSGTELNKQLKRMGLLSEKAIEQGKTRTTVNNKSIDYGFESEKRNYNGEEYEMVVINDVGKKFLLDNLQDIMNFK